MKIVHWIFGICLFTSSCDLILNFNFGGSFRLAQILMVFVCLAALARVLQDGRVLWGRGSTSIMLWMLVQLLFLPLGGVFFLASEFFVVLLFTVVGVFAIVRLYGDNDYIEPLMRTYLLSFVFVALFGLVQFTLPILHLPSPLVTQWIVHGRIARINGFCYEPSFFATYEIMGWITLVELRLSKARITAGKGWRAATIAVTLALIFSTSKTAWLFMLVELFARILPAVWRSIRYSLGELQVGRIVIPLPRARILAIAAAAILVLAGALSYVARFVNPVVLLAGTGLGNTAAHSVITRTHQMDVTIAAFKDNPYIGRSLGGVPIYLAAREGVVVHDMGELRSHWAFPVPLEVLVASGVFGVIPFLVFIYANTFGALRLARRRWPDERAIWLRALARSLIFEWVLLLADQNLLRVYLWFHFAVVAAVAYHLEFSPPPEPIAAAAVPILVSGLPEASAV